MQWIPSHCGIYGNEQADELAKEGANQEQQNNPANLTEMKTIIKSLFHTPHPHDSYHQLSRPEQVVIFRLRTGHSKLNQHLHRKLNMVPSPMCTCGDSEHILQTCRIFKDLRESIWTTPTTLQNKLYGTIEDLQKTTQFITESNIQA